MIERKAKLFWSKFRHLSFILYAVREISIDISILETSRFYIDVSSNRESSLINLINIFETFMFLML